MSRNLTGGEERHIESDRARQTDQPRFGNDEKDLLEIQQVHCEELGSLSSPRW